MRGNGWKDIQSAEKWWTYADATRGILRQRKQKAVSGSIAGSENGRIETRVGIEVMEIFWWTERNWQT